MQQSPGLSARPLGTNGNQWRRFLFHHVLLALASAAVLLAFMTLPLFDADASPHGDIVSGAFPQEPREGAPIGHGAEPSGSHHHGVQTGSTGHNSDHSGHATPMSHSGHGGIGRQHPADIGSMVHGTADTNSTEPADSRSDVAPPRSVRQFTVATGYVGVGWLALTLLLGPANLVLRKRNPVSSYLRRDVGIWVAIFGVVHVISALLMHVSHGSSLTASFLHFFVDQGGRPLTNSFGLGNWTGLVALMIVLGLLATSTDSALRKLKTRPWKRLQRLNYALFALVFLHASFYGALLRMTSPFTLLLLVSVIAVLVGQTVGFWLWPRRHSSIDPRQP